MNKAIVTLIKFMALYVMSVSCIGASTHLPHQLIVKFKPTIKVTSRMKQDQTKDPVLNKYDIQKMKLWGEKLKRMKNSRNPNRRSVRGQSLQNQSIRSNPFDQIVIITFKKNVEIEKVKEDYEKSNKVEWVQFNKIYKTQLIPNDERFSDQHGAEIIGMPKVWDITRGTSNVVVAVIDTGVKWMHPDLADNIWSNPNEIANNNKDDDNNGYVDDIRGWDFVDVPENSIHQSEDGQGEDNDPDDVFLHGTHVAGIISAVMNNKIGIAGIAPNCKIMALKAGYKDSGGEGSFPSKALSKAIFYAVKNGANIINMSLGGPGEDPLISIAIKHAIKNDVLVIAASGNGEDNTGTAIYIGPDSPFIPATDDGVFTVGSVKKNKKRSTFSNYGPVLDICAPGENILSTYYNPENNEYGYRTFNGTSQSAPYVAGVAALLFSLKPTISATEVKNYITQSATDLGENGKDQDYGYGLVNPYEAIKLLDTRPPEITHETPTTINLGEDVKISIKVSDELANAFVPSTNLYYRWTSTISPSLDWIMTTMNIASNGQLTVEHFKFLSTPKEDKKLQYYFLVKDLHPEHNVLKPEEAPLKFYEVNTEDSVGPKIIFPYQTNDYTSLKQIKVSLLDNTGVSPNTIKVEINNEEYELSNDVLEYSDPILLIDLSKLEGDLTVEKISVSISVKDIYDNESQASLSFNKTSTLSIFGPEGETSPILVAPNPFDPNQTEARICYQNTSESETTVYIYSLNLELVKTFQREDYAGYHDDLIWDGKDEDGDNVPNGGYVIILKFKNENKTIVKKTKVAVYRK